MKKNWKNITWTVFHFLNRCALYALFAKIQFGRNVFSAFAYAMPFQLHEAVATLLHFLFSFYNLNMYYVLFSYLCFSLPFTLCRDECIWLENSDCVEDARCKKHSPNRKRKRWESVAMKRKKTTVCEDEVEVVVVIVVAAVAANRVCLW